jgi:tellurite resistance protein TerC
MRNLIIFIFLLLLPALATADAIAPADQNISVGTPLLWAIFFCLVVIVLLIDLVFVGGGKQHRVSLKEAGTWSLIWITLAMLFGGGLWWYLDHHYTRELANTKTLEYLTGYLVEKSLAIDNVFVWLMLFNFFAIPFELQTFLISDLTLLKITF